MEPQATLAGDLLLLEFTHPEGIRDFVEKAVREGGFFVSLPVELRLFQQILVKLAADGVEVEIQAEVLQIIETGGGMFGTAMAFQNPNMKALKKICPAAGAHKERAARLSGEPEQPLSTKLREMNVTEKARLAMKASRQERQFLLRDRSPNVMTGLLSNPRIEDGEVLELARSRYASPGILQRIAKTRKWNGNYEIQLALVKNPKTPTPIILRLLPGLRKPDLGMLSKASAVRDNVRRAALRIYLKRK